MISILLGSNWFAIKQELDRIVSDFEKKHGSLAIERLYAPEAEKDTIFTVAGARSLFSEDRLVIMTDLSRNKAAAEEIDSLISSIDDSTVAVLVENSLDKRSVYYKTLKKLPGFKEFNELSDDALARWLVAYAESMGAKLNIGDARYLIERTGNNQTVLERELTKLALYDKSITREKIHLLTEATPQSTVFQLVETAFSGNGKRALELYNEQRALRKEPQAIFGMLVWQMHLVAVCTAAGSKSAREIAGETGLKEYSLSKAQAVARRMGTEKVRDFLTLLRDMEKTAKSQTYNLDDGLRFAIVQLSRT